jgi:hypothetical protein
LSKDEFLAWAAAHTPWTQPPVPITQEWRADAEWWDRLEEAWRCHWDFLDNLLQSVSKIGRIWVSATALREYSQELTAEEQVAIYLHIRDRYPWREPEFRPDFEQGFPLAVPLLPPPLSDSEWQRLWDEVVRNSVPREEPF